MNCFKYFIIAFTTLQNVSNPYMYIAIAASNEDKAKYCGLDRLKRTLHNCLNIYSKYHGNTYAICKSIMNNENNSLTYMKCYLKNNNLENLQRKQVKDFINTERYCIKLPYQWYQKYQ
ncbi:hypothetical protein PIROE2DRAFT_8568 [Piromyces sp. E2]|nr:hypothetical protein PIROE2DRAFT_8568 [Piromyces sp. E2]|eukprot:OUM64578.1 hypothetical protein PIROE2DRAFT_8568 [Piromyces sp. E2]